MASAREESMLNSVTCNRRMFTRKEANKGAWTAEEDRKLAQVISIHGAKKWKIIAAKAGLNRCGKSCRLRWLNYLRPNIKRGNISDQEEDLILRLHKLLGNRWSLIAGRLPGRTDNEIKNYWNSHLSKKVNQKKNTQSRISNRNDCRDVINLRGTTTNDIINKELIKEDKQNKSSGDEEEESNNSFDVDDFFDFSNEEPLNFEWISKFIDSSSSS